MSKELPEMLQTQCERCNVLIRVVKQDWELSWRDKICDDCNDEAKDSYNHISEIL